MKKIIILIPIMFLILISPAFAFEIVSPINTTYSEGNITIAYIGNVSSWSGTDPGFVTMTIDDQLPETFSGNKTITFINGIHHIILKANETTTEGNITTFNETIDEVWFTVYAVSVDYCAVGWDILSTHGCTNANVSIVQHICIPTKCEEMLQSCQSQILPEIQTEYRNLRSDVSNLKKDLDLCLAQQDKNLALWAFWIVSILFLIWLNWHNNNLN